MDFVKLNNTIEPKKVLIKSDYQDKVKIDTPAPMTVFGNCGLTKVQYDYNFEDEYPFVEKFDLDEDEMDDNVNKKDNNEDKKNDVKVKMVHSARVVVEKLPDSVVQQYLAKKAKNYQIMSFRQKLSKSNKQTFVKKDSYKADNREVIPVLKQYLTKKQNLETDEFVKELCKPTMQQYLANTEMGDLGNFKEQIPEPQEYIVKVNDYTIDSLIKNLSGTDDALYPVKLERNDQTDNYPHKYSVKMEQNCKADNFIKSLPYPTVQKSNVDLSFLNMQEPYVHVEKIDNFIKDPASFTEQDKSTQKKNISKAKRCINRKRSRKNLTTKLCKRICPNCQAYVQKAYKASLRVNCHKCKTLTLYECNKCKKQAQSYSGISHHLLYQCEARTFKKCGHCQYSVKRKHALESHIKRIHVKIMSPNFVSHKKSKKTETVEKKLHQGSEHERQYENLIVLKKQKEMKSKSEWFIENVKRSDSRVDKNIGLSVLTKSISTLPVPDPTGVKEMFQLYCDYCDMKIAIDGSYNQSEIHCRYCGTVLLFKCLKCHSTCRSYHAMKHHLKRDCTFKENIRKSFHCSECNYRSFFHGLLINHHNKIHNSIHTMQESFHNNLIKTFSDNDLDFYLSEQETGEL